MPSCSKTKLRRNMATRTLASSSLKKGGSGGGDKDDPESKQRKRLETLALNNKLFSDSPSTSLSSLKPSKQVRKHHGTDIIRKPQRKNRFLFSFPGLLAPISAATIGDIWSAGVIIYILLCGTPPFWAETVKGIFEEILRGEIDFESKPWPSISVSAKE